MALHYYTVLVNSVMTISGPELMNNSCFDEGSQLMIQMFRNSVDYQCHISPLVI